MSWKDFYRRRDVIDTVLRLASRDPEGELPFDEVTGATELFGTKQDLLLALHHKWTRLLSGYLRAESACPDDANALLDQETDQIDAVSRAWRKATREHPTLRAVLDAHIDESAALLAMHRAEQRMLAVTAGLAEPGEPIAELTKIGVAFGALLRSGPARPARRRSPVGHLLRMLAPSA
jgi:predicted RNA-binding Zn ribbon-like protein